jgi:hypothetical protein
VYQWRSTTVFVSVSFPASLHTMPEMAVRDHSLSAALYLCRKRTDVEGELGTGEEVIRLLRAGSVGVQVRIRHLTRASSGSDLR